MQKYSKETAVGLFVLAGLSAITYMTIKLGNVSIGNGGTYPIEARFTTVTGLKVNSPVYLEGIEIGHVDKLSLDQEKQQAIVELRILKGTQIYDDAIASIKTEGLIGDKYVSIDPGGGGKLLKPGGTITDTQPPVDITDLIWKYAFGSIKK